MIFKYLGGLFRAAVCFLTLTVSSAAYTATFTDVYIFGDSLSDTNAGFSNGPLWPEYLAPQLGISYNPGTNLR